MEKKKPLYMISVVAEILNIHPQTLRIYEREGFIKPKRTEGNTRLYSDEDIEKIKMVLRFT
jgi:MerR family transcriptional regulator/heat shock protein HspR